MYITREPSPTTKRRRVIVTTFASFANTFPFPVPSLTFSVAGIVKEIVTILAAVLIMPGEGLTLLNALGLGVSIAGIVYYNIIKLRLEIIENLKMVELVKAS